MSCVPTAWSDRKGLKRWAGQGGAAVRARAVRACACQKFFFKKKKHYSVLTREDEDPLQVIFGSRQQLVQVKGEKKERGLKPTAP